MLLTTILVVVAGLEAVRARRSMPAGRPRWLPMLVFAIPTVAAVVAVVVIVAGTSYFGMPVPARATRLIFLQMIPWLLLAVLAWRWRFVRDQLI